MDFIVGSEYQIFSITFYTHHRIIFAGVDSLKRKRARKRGFRERRSDPFGDESGE
jgi:hypothetical protein